MLRQPFLKKEKVQARKLCLALRLALLSQLIEKANINKKFGENCILIFYIFLIMFENEPYLKTL